MAPLARVHSISHQGLHFIRLRLLTLSRIKGRRMSRGCSCWHFYLWAVDIVVVVVITALDTLDRCFCLSCHHGTLSSGAWWLRTCHHGLITNVIGHCRSPVVLNVSQLKADDLNTIGIKVTHDACVLCNKLRVTKRRANHIRLNVECTFSASINLHVQ